MQIKKSFINYCAIPIAYKYINYTQMCYNNL